MREPRESSCKWGTKRGTKCLLQYIHIPTGKWRVNWHRSYCSTGAFFFFPKLFVFKFLNLSKPNPVQKNFCSSSRDTRAVSGKCKKKINKKNCTLIHMKWLDSKLKRGCFRANDVTKLLTIIKEKLSKPLRQKQIRQNKVRILLYDLKHAPYKNDGWKHENTCIRKGWKWTDCSIFQSL